MRRRRPERGRARGVWTALLASTFWSGALASAQEAPTALPPVVVSAPPLVSSSSEQLIPGKDFELRPEGRPADIPRLVIAGATSRPSSAWRI